MVAKDYYRAYITSSLGLFSETGEDYYVVYSAYPVIKETPCGVWIKINWQKKRFINSSSRKKFAYPTRDEAFQALGFRLNSYICILRSRLEEAEMHRKVYAMYKSGERK